MIDGHETISTISIRKRRISPEHKWAARDLLRTHFGTLGFRGGQLVIHYGPGGNPVWLEVQERVEKDNAQELQLDKLSKVS